MTAATIVHQTPGRIRMRIPGKRRDASYFDRLSERLADIEGVRGVQVNASTGSVVMRYAGDIDPLLQRMEERIPRLVIEKTHRLSRSSPVRVRPFRLVSGRVLSPMFMAGTALAAVGIVQTVRGKIAVPSITAFWYALESFRKSAKRS